MAMILDYSNTFSSDPGAGFATLTQNGSALAASYNASAQAVDLSIGTYGSGWIITSQPTSGVGVTPGYTEKLIFEADLELVSDPSGRKHPGIWLVKDGPLVVGYRIAHLDGGWVFSKRSSWSGEAGIAITLLNNPSFNAGERKVVRVEVLAGYFSVYVDGINIFNVTDATYENLRPGIFLYGCTLRVHSIHYQIDDIQLNIGEIGCDFVFANNETREQAWPGENIIKETPAHSPEKICHITSVSALNAPPSRKDFGFIEGVVTRKSVPAAGKHVICLDERFNLVAETTSAANGYYRFDNLLINGLYAIHAYDNDTYQYAPVGADRRTPEAYP